MKGNNGVTIGVPVYNESAFIDTTIHSAALQCEVLLVSDNCSSDDTISKCEAMASQYSNMTFIRQSSNIGAFANFKYLLELAETPYFMWLGGHDVLPENYVQEMKKALDEDADYILAFGSALHIEASGNKTYRYTYDYAPLLEAIDPGVRLMAILQKLSDCSLVHGVFRTAALKQAWVDEPYIGGDHVLLARAALRGRFKYLPETEYIRRDPHSADSHKEQLARIVGFVSEMPSNAYQNMQNEQYSMASNHAGYKGFRALSFRLKARFWLIYRFGVFGKSISAKFIDFLILQFGRIARRCMKLVRQKTT